MNNFHFCFIRPSDLQLNIVPVMSSYLQSWGKKSLEKQNKQKNKKHCLIPFSAFAKLDWRF